MNRLVVHAWEYYAENGGVVNGAIFLCAVIALYHGFERLFHYRSVVGMNQLSEEVRFRELLTLSQGLETMLAWISAAPLLGLLGTVIGMIDTFETIMAYGNSNPVFLTKGISLALHTTQAGLLVSIPILLFYSVLVQKRDRLQRFLEKGEVS